MEVRIKEIIKKYIEKLNWCELRQGLLGVLHKENVVYKQLSVVSHQEINSLWVACCEGCMELVLMLVDGGLPVNGGYFEVGETMLHAAITGSQLPLAKALVARGANLKVKNDDGDTLLIHAVRDGHFHIVKWLVDCGANVNSKSKIGWTALHQAAMIDSLEIAEFLIHAGAEPRAKCRGSGTPYDVARSYGNKDLANYLIRYGPPVW